MDTATSYWWYVNFTTGDIRLVGSANGVTNQGNFIQDVVWTSDGQSYYYLLASEPKDTEIIPGSDTTKLYKGSADGTEALVGPLAATAFVQADNSSIVYQSTAENRAVRSYDLARQSSTTILNNFVGAATFNNDASSGLFVTPVQAPRDDAEFSSDNTAGKLSLWQSAGEKTSPVADSFNGDTAWDGSNWIALAADASGGYRGTTSTQKNFVFGGKPAGTSHVSLCGYVQSIVCLDDEDNDILLASPSSIGPVGSDLGAIDKLQKGKLVIDQYRIAYDAANDQYDVYVYRNNAVNSAAVLQYIKSLGVDPYQLDIKWYTNSNEPLS
jgi:hypothetical protein